MNLLTLILIMSEAFYGFASVFIACDLCQRVTNEFDQINLRIGQFHWYLFPNELKRILPIMISVAQQPVQLELFKFISSLFGPISSIIIDLGEHRNIRCDSTPFG